MNLFGRWLIPFACLYATLVACCVPTHAIEVVAIYDEARSQPPEFDPDASRLTTLVEAAVAVYEDIIEDDFTIQLAYTWGDLGNTGTLGVATTLETDQGKPTVSRMRFNTNETVGWYLDDTPDNHDEFAMFQTIVHDLDLATKAESYAGSPPNMLEVAYAGTRIRRERTTDLYSIVLHEVGHAVGLGTAVIGPDVVDHEFDVLPEFLAGANAGLRTSSHEDTAHLAAPRSLMHPVVPQDVRRLPSATDIFAIASAAGWQELDLPRKELLAGTNWSSPEGWIGNRLPDADDAVQIRLGDELHIREPAVASTVLLEANSSLVVHASLASDQLELDGGNHRLILSDSFVGIHVAETAILGGTLEIELSDDITAGQTFELLMAENIEGSFTSIGVPQPGTSIGVVLDEMGDSLLATVALVGDLNLDGSIDFSDFVGLSRNFSEEGGWREGDFTGDGRVEFLDFVAMSRQFGMSTPMSTQSIPEPVGVNLALAGVLLLFNVRGRRRG